MNNLMDIDAYRDLRLLTEISSEEVVTQRSLAKKHGLALGLTNLLIRRLVRKGHVKIVNLNHNRIRYLITPQGLVEKARLTYAYLEYSLYFYRQIRTFLTRALSTIRQSEGKDVLLYGTGEVAEIAFVIFRQNGFEIVAVMDEDARNDASFLSHSVRRMSDLSTLSFDRVVVASLAGRGDIVQQLIRRGVPESKIIAIPDEQTPEFRQMHTTPMPSAPVPLLSEAPST